jgi:nicotinamide-nucleotide adenylyltransferase
MIALGCVTGRFQPVHEQHLSLFEIALADCRRLVVAVTNPDTRARHMESTSAHRHTAAANPFTYFERVRLLEAAMANRGLAERTTIVPFDLTRPDVWPEYVPLTARHFVRAFSDWERQKAQRLEQAGYQVTLLDGDPSDRLSASDIRAGMQAGDSCWHPLVPTGTVSLLDELLERVPMAERI